jgi:hypothetical protein
LKEKTEANALSRGRGDRKEDIAIEGSEAFSLTGGAFGF